MEIVRIEKTPFEKQEPTVLVLGYFDGIHLGHQAVFERARKIADEQGMTVSVLTFPESPKLAFTRFAPELLLHLTTEEKRYQLMADCGVDKLYLVDFTSDFAAHSPQDFVNKYIKKLGAVAVVTGFDYHFGNSRADVSVLRELFDGPVETVEEVQLDGQKISSTRIRQAIQVGQVDVANDLLGYSFATEGIVVHGDARGRTIGYPTANLAPFERVHLPADGVYVVDVEVDGQLYRGMASVGKNITFDGTELRLEAHLFGFDRMIYGEKLTIYWLKKIRDMVKFDGIDSLMVQMKEDEAFSLAWSSKKDL